jgi:hypothetical protein
VYDPVRTVHVYSTMAPMDVIGASLPTKSTSKSSARVPPIDRKPIMVSCGTSSSSSSGIYPIGHFSSPASSIALPGPDAADSSVSKPDSTTASANLVANASGSPMARVVTSSSSVSPGSGLSQGLTGLWSAVKTGLTSKCLRNSLQGLHYGGYKEVMYIPPRRRSITPS